MKPSKFRESTGILSGSSEAWIEDLPVFKDRQKCISLWRMSLQERLKALFTGKVWCHVYSGDRTQPPVYLGTRYPFIITKEKNK